MAKIKYRDIDGNWIEVGSTGGGGTGGGIIEKTYQELYDLWNNSTLVPGQTYLITDYQTVHNIPRVRDLNVDYNTPLVIGTTYIIHTLNGSDDFSNVGYVREGVTFIATNTTPNIWTNYTGVFEYPYASLFIGEIEPLVITANSNETFNPICYSPNYPFDVIYYDINNNQDAIPGCTKGYIYRRIDTKQNNDFPFDFRNVVFRRWQIDVTDIWISGNTYNKGAWVLKENTTEIYISLFDNNTTGLSDYKSKWLYFGFPNLSYILPTTNSNDDGYNSYVTSEYTDYNIISDWNYYYNGVYNNTIEGKTFGHENSSDNILVSYNTVILPDTYNTIFFCNNTITGEFDNNTISARFSENNIGGGFGDNYIVGTINQNNIGEQFYNNYIGNLQNNNIKSQFSGNRIGNIEFSNIDESFQSNHVGLISRCTIDSQFQSNSIINCSNNKVGWYFQNNSILYGFSSNQIGISCYDNEFGESFVGNRIGDGFHNNTILDSYMNNVILNQSMNNTIGNGFNRNQCGHNFSNNVTSNGMSNNIIGEDCYNCHFGDNFYTNTLKYNCGGLTTDNRGFKYNNLDNHIYGVNFSNYLHVDSEYDKYIKKNSNGTISLSYIDNYDDTITLNQSEIIPFG